MATHSSQAETPVETSTEVPAETPEPERVTKAKNPKKVAAGIAGAMA